MQALILSHFQARRLLQARAAGERRASVSPDLGLSTSEALLEAAGVTLEGQPLDWATVQEIEESPNNCFLLEEGRAFKIVRFSERTNRVYSLMPTEGAPTMLVSGIPMHRIKGTDPYRDTLAKLQAIRPVVGPILDTATGLGYTAIEAAKHAKEVVTIELDPVVLEIARLNPWSRALFSGQIERHIGDSAEWIETLADASFARIIHDPPAFSLAGELYGGAFYRQLYRVLGRGGRLFHYVGNPESASGRNITRGVMRRLQEAAFSRVVRRPEAFGVVAYK